MFKNMIKRSWLSISRKLSRTVLLMLVLFAMANLVLAAIVIKSAVATQISYAKSSLSGTVYLQPDLTKAREQARQNSTPTESPDGTVRLRMEFERPTIPASLAQNLANSQYVKDYTYSIQSSANAKSYTPIETEQQRMRQQIQENQTRTGPERGGIGGTIIEPGNSGIATFTFGAGDTTIMGVNSYAFIPDVESGNMTLNEGKIFDESTNGGAIISYDLATENNISIGDQITLSTTSEDNPIDVTLTVIGIYDNATDNFDPNTIYANIDAVAQFLPEDEYNNGDYNVENVKYYLTSAEYKDAFLAEANQKQPNLADKNLTINIDDAAYQQMVGPIEGVGSFATTVLVIVIIAAIVIITLIVTINIKDRRYEMGVLLSLGASKKNIIGQITTELVVIGTAGFILASLSGTFLAQTMGQGILDSQIAASQQTPEDNLGPIISGNPRGASRAPLNILGNPSGQNSDADPIAELDINAQPIDFLLLFITGYLVIILALIVPSTNILRYQPKEILSGKE